MLTIEFLNEEDEIYYTVHAEERMVLRDGKWVNVPRERIENIIRPKFERMKRNWPIYDTFVFRNPIDGLHIVGELQKLGKDWRFKVATVMFKHGFVKRPKDYLIKVYESTNLMMFESFMDAHGSVLEIASAEGDLFDYEQTEMDPAEGLFSWTIQVRDGQEVDDEITINIHHSKEPITRPEMTSWMEKFEDLIECLGMFDGNDVKQSRALRERFDARKWSKMIDIAEVEMLSKKFDYEKTGYGKDVALKLLRTRFHIIKGWVNAYRPDVFLSKPKKETQTDNRRMRIYELYFRKYLTDYSVVARDMSTARPWFSSDTLVCISNRLSERMLSSLEADVEEAIY